MSERSAEAAIDVRERDSGTERHAQCPQCDYDLTGLPEPRCPECGLAFSWEDLPRLRNLPTIAFEKGTGWGRVGGFLRTAATVLLTPWVFARQCVRRMNWRAGLLFGLCCFLTTPISLIFGADLKFLTVWFTTAVIYVLVQACVLALLDWPHWRDGVRSWLFWLGISGYTSAVVMSELFHGPPQIELMSIAWLIRGGGGGFFNMPSEPVVHWTQMAVWIAGIVCIVVARLVSRQTALGAISAIAVAAVVLLYVMYALAIEQVGMRLYDLLD